MRWRNLERSKNVEDRRGQTAKVAGGIGGLGIIGVLSLSSSEAVAVTSAVWANCSAS
ncbi:MAG: hypothetical protein U9N84_05335 [Actinomycetota bacterium]|nr:hypothetical protein [Actinomycetota bacterium]